WENISSLNVEDRNKYIFFKGILNTCDWYGSSHNNLSGFLRIDKDSLKEKISKKVDSPIHFDDFQNQCADIASDCLILAPTGSGKTEAALLWSGLKSGKIIYLLPTRVTSNAIYERMKTYFGELNVGLVHSAAIDYHFDKEKDYDTKDYFVEKTFFKPLTVATIDQLLSTGFNVGHWAVKELNCVGAKIIIDEIHAYDFYTLGLTVASIRHFKKSGASFFLMSATIPRFLMELIQKEIPDIKVIKNDSLLNKSRNRFIIKNHGIDGCEQEIAERIHDGKKVLIVVNTVNEAIKLYERYARYEEFSPICYHSRFIVKDRSKKEDEIIKASETSPGGCLVITTQVVEVSLDIDFDILFTENAPADAIIQRAGRINRRRKKPDSAVIIVKHRDVSEKVYNPLLLQKSYNEFSKYHDKPINEEDFLSIVNNVYKDVNVESNENYIAGLGQYKKIQEHYNYIQDVSPNEGEVFTRVRNYLKISVIPDRFLKEVVDLKPHRKAKYLVDVPYWLKKKSYQTGDGFLYCPLDYNKQRGAILDYKMTGDGGCYVL
ncbi:MAG: CRISPR-associated helicase Cas3', partial [Candidatus Marinimicrobia bacterium]|nr:CRISPR-associated helicase Cas3' [Candidatus Neomarinimicrobiota bacterium]